jgi:hypothetical protein
VWVMCRMERRVTGVLYGACAPITSLKNGCSISKSFLDGRCALFGDTANVGPSTCSGMGPAPQREWFAHGCPLYHAMFASGIPWVNMGTQYSHLHSHTDQLVCMVTLYMTSARGFPPLHIHPEHPGVTTDVFPELHTISCTIGV